MHEDTAWTAKAYIHPHAPFLLCTKQCQSLTYLEEIYAQVLIALASNII